MPSRDVVLASRIGLHGRPAAMVVQAAATYPATITLAKGDSPPVPATSILAVLALGARHGDTLTITTSGPNAEATLTAIATLLTTDLDQPTPEPPTP
jgi:phosphocarrier protein HPr